MINRHPFQFAAVFKKIHRACLVGVLSLLPVVFIAATPLAATESSAPIQVEADRMESFQQQSQVFFSGNVIARQDDFIIHADELTVHYAKPDGGKPAGDTVPQVETLTAKGNVKIIRENWVATGGSMNYIARERKVRLSDNAMVVQEKNKVTGDTIVLFLDEGKSVVEGSAKDGERVKAFIYPESDPAEEIR